MTIKFIVTDEQDKRFQNRLWELENRWRKDILDPEQTLAALQMLIENKQAVVDYAGLISEWQVFYHGLGIDCDLSGIRIPDDPGGFGRIIIVVQGIAPQSAYDLCAKNFPCWKYTDKSLSEIMESERTARNGAYAIRVRDRVEADEELKNLSAHQLKQQNISGITLEERLIYELKFSKETGKHLDIQNATLCAGSRYRGGGVPGVFWVGGEVSVGWRDAGFTDFDLRSRQVVS